MGQRDRVRRGDTGTPGNRGLFDYARDESTLTLTDTTGLTAQQFQSRMAALRDEYDEATEQWASDPFADPRHLFTRHEEIVTRAGVLVAERADTLTPPHPPVDEEAVAAFAQQAINQMEELERLAYETAATGAFTPERETAKERFDEASTMLATIDSQAASELGIHGYHEYLNVARVHAVAGAERTSDASRTAHEYAFTHRDDPDAAKNRSVTGIVAKPWSQRVHIIEHEREKTHLIEGQIRGETFKAALSEVRDLDGTIALHENTVKKARTLFEDASDVYPADWLTYSNATEGLPLAKISKRRAHYAHIKHHAKRERRPIEYSRFAFEPDDNPAEEWELVGDSGLGDGRNHWKVRSFEVRDIPAGRPVAETKPRGNGWKLHADADGDTMWRRPLTRMHEVESEVAPEILSSDPKHAEARSTAIHELAHRMEYTVPEVTMLEQAFLRRRLEGDKFRLGGGYRRNEMFRDGGFVDKYIGKQYKPHETWEETSTGRRGLLHQPAEVLSMGMESVFTGRYGGLEGRGRYKPDLDHRNFVLGVLAMAGRPGACETEAMRRARKDSLTP